MSIKFNSIDYIRVPDEEFTKNDDLKSKLVATGRFAEGKFKDIYGLNKDNYVLVILKINNHDKLDPQSVLDSEIEGFRQQNIFSEDSTDIYGIPRIYEYGKMTPKNSGNSLYYAIMENAGNVNLKELIDAEFTKYNGGEFSIFFGQKLRGKNVSDTKQQETVSLNRKKLFYRLLKSLQIIHNNEYIHQDIKLDQFVTKDDISKINLLDFGFSDMIGEKINNAKGTSGYMSPKLRYFQKPDITIITEPCMDIFSLGVCFLYIITGEDICTRGAHNLIKFWGCAFNNLRIEQVFTHIYQNSSILLTDEEKENMIPIIKKMLMVKSSELGDCKGEEFGDFCCKYENVEDILQEIYFYDVDTCEQPLEVVTTNKRSRDTADITTKRRRLYKKPKSMHSTFRPSATPRATIPTIHSSTSSSSPEQTLSNSSPEQTLMGRFWTFISPVVGEGKQKKKLTKKRQNSLTEKSKKNKKRRRKIKTRKPRN